VYNKEVLWAFVAKILIILIQLLLGNILLLSVLKTSRLLGFALVFLELGFQQ
jgi:hypothetical protein